MKLDEAENDLILLRKNRPTSVLHSLLSAINYKMTVKDIHHPREIIYYNTYITITRGNTQEIAAVCRKGLLIDYMR